MASKKRPPWLYSAVILWLVTVGVILVAVGNYLEQDHLSRDITVFRTKVATVWPTDDSASHRVVEAAEIPNNSAFLQRAYPNLIILPEVVSAGETIQVQGMGFLPQAAVTVYLKGDELDDLILAETYADKIGMLNANLSLPAVLRTYTGSLPLIIEAVGEGEAEMKYMTGKLWLRDAVGAASEHTPTVTPTPQIPTPGSNNDGQASISNGPSPTPQAPTCTFTCTPRPTPTVTPTPLPPPTPTPIRPFMPEYPHWRVEYFNNTSWEGEPVFVTDLPRSEFNLLNEAPSALVGRHWYSARLTALAYFEEREYQFFLVADDQAYVSITKKDGQQDFSMKDVTRIYVQQPTVKRYNIYEGGEYQIQINYVQHWGQAKLYFAWEPAVDHARWWGTYFEGPELSGRVIDTNEKTEADLQCVWNKTVFPHNAGAITTFSSQWSRHFEVSPGIYQFCIFAEDGVRLWLDREQHINDWQTAPSRFICTPLRLNARTHYLFIEHFVDQPGSCLGFWMRRSGSDHWAGAYYDYADPNFSFQDMPVLVRSEKSLNFDWGSGAPPGTTLSPDHFSARWQRTIALPWGEHLFYLQADDGAHLKINGQVVWDSRQAPPIQWHNPSPVYQIQGRQEVDVEVAYYEQEGEARVRFWIATPMPLPTPTSPNTPTPSITPTPSPTITPTPCCILPPSP